MEWIETTGLSIDEAKERALDRLGVPEDDLDYEVLVEPTSTLFGLRRTDARLRARVRPISPRSKEERRDQGRRRGQKSRSDRNKDGHKSNPRGSKRASDHGVSQKDNDESGSSTARQSDDSARSNSQSRRKSRSNTGAQTKQGDRRAAEHAKKRDTSRSGSKQKQDSSERVKKGDNGSSDDRKGTEVRQMDLKTQARVTEDFVRGLLEKMGLEARVVSSIDEDRLLVEAQGLNLGLAIGPRGETVRAITQLARTMVQRMSDGDAEGSLVVDIGGYRERRRSFLNEFANARAEEVLVDGRSRALEPMGAADRKVIHDAVGEISGVTTRSDGSEMDRHVVILAESEE